MTYRIFAILAILALVSTEFMTAANAGGYNPFDCSQRWGSNSSACNTGGDGNGGGGHGGGGGGRH